MKFQMPGRTLYGVDTSKSDLLFVHILSQELELHGKWAFAKIHRRFFKKTYFWFLSILPTRVYV